MRPALGQFGSIDTKYLPSCNLIYNDGETIYPISEMAFQVKN